MSALERDPVMQAVLRACIEGTTATAGWVVRGGASPHVVEASFSSPEIRAVELESSLAAMVLASGSPAALTDIRASHGFALEERVLGAQPRALLCVPCVDAEGQVVAAIELADPDGDSFTFDDIELVTLLAGVGAAALQTYARHTDPQVLEAQQAYQKIELGAQIGRAHV